LERKALQRKIPGSAARDINYRGLGSESESPDGGLPEQGKKKKKFGKEGGSNWGTSNKHGAGFRGMATHREAGERSITKPMIRGRLTLCYQRTTSTPCKEKNRVPSTGRKKEHGWQRRELGKKD